MYEESVYYKKWSYLKYCTEMIKYGLKHNLALRAATSSDRDSVNPYENMESRCSLPITATLFPLGKKVTPFRMGLEAVKIPVDMSVEEWVGLRFVRRLSGGAAGGTAAGEEGGASVEWRPAQRIANTNLTRGHSLATWTAEMTPEEVGQLLSGREEVISIIATCL